MLGGDSELKGAHCLLSLQPFKPPSQMTERGFKRHASRRSQASAKKPHLRPSMVSLTSDNSSKWSDDDDELNDKRLSRQAACELLSSTKVPTPHRKNSPKDSQTTTAYAMSSGRLSFASVIEPKTNDDSRRVSIGRMTPCHGVATVATG